MLTPSPWSGNKSLSQKACILELKRRYFEDYYSDNQYAVSIKEDTAYLCVSVPPLTKDHKGNMINTPSVETEFPAIAFNDGVSSEKTISCEPTLSSLNNEIDFRISFDDSDDEDYTVIFDKNLLSYKIISTNDLKTDSENDNEIVNMPSLPPPEPTVSCFDDLDFFKDFENEFPAIVYNDAPTSKSDLLIEPILSPQHIDLNDETSLSEFDEEEQNVLYFNDLFPFNVIYPDDLKSDTDNGNDEIDLEQPSGDMFVIPLPDVINVNAQGSNKLLETNCLYGVSKPHGYGVLTIWTLSSFIFSTVYTAYSLNEYIVFDTCINMAYPGDLAAKKSTMLVKYLQAGILAQ
ncbi:hypothetical protein Tco_1279607 [Tanacetum coccineum]